MESFQITITVQTYSGKSSQKDYFIDVSAFLPLPGTISIKDRGYNTGPQVFDIWDPVKVQIGSSEIVTIKHEIYDLQSDIIDFEWLGVEETEMFA